jgi:hypothetical protein
MRYGDDEGMVMMEAEVSKKGHVQANPHAHTYAHNYT